MKKISVGDTVSIDGDSSFCHLHTKVVTKIETRYDVCTGDAYDVICCGSHKFDSRDGCAITSPTMYYIDMDIEEELAEALQNEIKKEAADNGTHTWAELCTRQIKDL